ncbi:MAG: tetratricopeptide repeat protein [Alphaproteobacteria bacterium]|nr:tetratricopeptide repeat protein [Alphaproteobacteria bacterium]
MASHLRIFRHGLRSSALATLVAISAAPFFAHAFNPDEGAEAPPVSKPRTSARLPSTAPLIDPMPRLAFPPLSSVPATTSITAPPGAFVQPLPAEAPLFPPVDAATAARAAQELGVTGQVEKATTLNVAPQTGFIAPAPLIATADSLQRPAENPPLIAAPATAPAPRQLSDASRNILSRFPSRLDSTPPATGKKTSVAIQRQSPEVKALATPTPKIESYDAVGLSIKVQRQALDTNFELNRAYTALSNGDSALAAETYKTILAAEPGNEDALFGLAVTYHRLGELARARSYYDQLLKINPGHREGLNNFLALMSAEAPQEALAELERLEQRNPDFSPIPAQQAALLNKSGYPEQAREKMLRAIELAPDNLTYKYNLAVMLDAQGNYADAGALYRLLIDAALKGQKIPAPLETLQKRLNFIAAKAAPTPVAGS